MKEKICPKCKKLFIVEYPSNKKFCSRKCANSRAWSKQDREKLSISAKKSEKVKRANKLIGLK